MPRLAAALTASALALVACGSKHRALETEGTASAAPFASGVLSASSASAAPAPDKAAELRLGRKLAQAGKWKEAVAALGRAAEAAPDDSVVLSELGWAQLKAGDLDASRKTSERALDIAHETRSRAQILYNLGRVDEAQHDEASAKKRYEASLSLRPNRTVSARLEALGGKQPAEAPPPSALVCDRVFPNTQALCDCLLADKGALAATDAKLSCGADKKAPRDESGELTLLRFGVDEGAPGEIAHLLTANVAGGVRPVAELGRDFSGASGVSNRVTLRGFETKTSGSRRVVLVKSEARDADTSEGGEAYLTVTLRATVCVLRDADHETQCPVTLPLEIHDSLSTPGPDSADGGFEHEARFDLALSDRKATLSLASGMASLAPKSALGPHVLW